MMADLQLFNQPKPLGWTVIFCNAAFRLFTVIVRFIFRFFIYGVNGARMPSIKDPVLLESASSLAKKIRRKEVKSVDVMNSFIRRIEEVNPLLNCCVDECFTIAIENAKAADELILSEMHTEEYLEKTMPFLGVPISTKDCLSVKGLSHSAGLYARRNVKANEDSDVIALMRKAGAIPFCITNVPEMCMWWETTNTIYGKTCNPYDTNRIVGGSSGGEGCLLAAAGSPFGLGSDIGGSIRMPAFFNGIFGHKPSKSLVSNKGQFPMPFSSEQETFLGIGPMCRFAEDLKPMLRIIADKKADLLNLDEEVNFKKVKFFYQESDGGGRFVSPVDNDIKEAMRKVVSHLELKFNIQVERVQIEKIRQSAAIWFANMKDDSGKGFDHQLANLNGRINPFWEIFKWIFGASKHTFVGLITTIVERSQPQHGSRKHIHLVKKRDELRKEIQLLLGDNGVLLYPTHPTVAPYHNEPLFRPINFSYTGIVNVLGFPATAVPLGTLGSEGLPLGIQVIANFMQDRLCLALAQELESKFGGWVKL